MCEKNILSDIPVAGFAGTSMVDYPEHIASTIFIAGCDLRCPYCHNHTLFSVQSDTLLSANTLQSRLEERIDFIDGICVTGGEPLLYSAIIPFISVLKNRFKLPVKVDTNGLHPDLLKDVVPLVDFVAVDIKTDPSQYDLMKTPYDNTPELLSRTRDVLSDVSCTVEYRTTLYPPAVPDTDTLIRMEPFIPANTRWVFQQFKSDNAYANDASVATPFSQQHITVLAASMRKQYSDRTFLVRS